jgi:glucosyl-dolichyl phosphate glucuronosyltransferase
MSVPSEYSWELIVVDNNSSDSTKRCVSEFERESPMPVRYIFEGRQGKPFALNTGIQNATGEILLFTDDDVIVSRDWLANIVNTFKDANCIGLGGKIVPVWPDRKPAWFQTDGPYGLMSAIANYDLGEVECELTLANPPFGANAAFHRTAFERYGHYRTDLWPSDRKGYGEDTEFARRLIRSGEKLTYSPTAVVYHHLEPQRTRKRYFQLWHFEYGKSLIKLEANVPSAVRYFGVPRYVIRSFFESGLRWLVAGNGQKRFYYKLQTYLFAGEIVAAYRTRSI